MAAPAPFTWPPRPVPSDGKTPEISLPPAEPAAARSVRARWGGWTVTGAWQSAERTWLDPVREPLARRIADLGWAPDAFDAYCDRCGHTIGAHERHEYGCGACMGRRPAWDRIVRLGAFEHELREWILEAKFEASHTLALALGHRLGARMREAGVGTIATSLIVVPVPTSRVRRFLRGIDHTMWIARGVARELDVPVRPLLAARFGPSQRAVAPSRRAANVRGRFRARRDVPPGVGLILIDDVLTTGATVSQALRALGGRRNARWCGVLGVTPDPEREPVRGAADVDVEEKWTTRG